MFAVIRRVLPVVIGLLLIAIAIWFAGPYFAFMDYRPFESVPVRVACMLLVVAAWLGLLLYRRVRAKRAGEKLVAAVVRQAASKDLPSAEVTQLRERFEEAVATLSRSPRGSRSLYELPWYVFIGAPGSGKTTALVNSGLHFPLEQRSGRNALRGIGGTRNCDWWFTDEAVFLDTAGRYTTQDSDAASDREAWVEFLALLKKYRPRRPLNGVILTISMQDLMMQADGAFDRQVEAARRRLDELNRDLRIPLPVYVLVTKCDLVAGFTEHFDDLNHEGRAQVWGVTFPYEQTIQGQAAQHLRPELDRLIARLNERVFARVEDSREPRRRALAFAFPQQMAALRDQLADVVRGVFSSTRFDKQVLLRGVYFTSGTQEGTPIDRLLGAMSRARGVSAPMPAAGGKGKAYFIERLLTDVLFAESGLAGVNRRFEVQMAAVQLGAYALMALALMAGVVLWSVSYSRNRSYLDAVGVEVAKLEGTPPIRAGAPLSDSVRRLDALRVVVNAADTFRDGAPWSMRWGLFQGRALSDNARDAYSRELSGALLSQMAVRFRDRLREYAAEPEKLYPYLKAYLMLGDPSHLRKEELAFLADIEWQNAFADDPDVAERMTKHFRSLLDYQDTLRPVPIDMDVVVQARSTLKQASLAGLVYRYIRIKYANDTARGLRLDLAAGLGAEKVLRLEGRSLTQPIPSIYTKPIFQQIVKTGTDDLITELTSEFWVWGDARPTFTASGQLRKEFFDVYEDDYIRTWDTVVKGMRALPASSPRETQDSLAILSAETSPLRGLLRTIDEHTYLLPPPEPPKPGVLPGITGGLVDLLQGVKQKAGVPTVTPGAKVTMHFDDIHRLVAGENPPIDVVIKKIQELQQKMAPMGNSVGGTRAGDPALMQSIGQSANDLKRDAAPLPPSVATVVTQVADGAARAVRVMAGGDLGRRYAQDVVRECSTIVANRYPFFETSTVDVPLADFGRLLGYGGVYEAFFKAELSDYVDTSRSPWVWRTDSTGAPVGGSLDMLRRFEAAERIRQTYFRAGASEPELRFTVTPDELDAGAQRVVLAVDGQTLEYRHEAPRGMPMVWPGPKPALASATFYERGPNGTNTVHEGAWAWFRLLDSARLDRQTDTRFALTVSAAGHEARWLVDAPSIRNPYGKRDLQQFRCE